MHIIAYMHPEDGITFEKWYTSAEVQMRESNLEVLLKLDPKEIGHTYVPQKGKKRDGN